MAINIILTSFNHPSSLTPKAPLTFKGRDEEGDWDHLDTMPRRFRGDYRAYIAPSDPSLANKLDSLREKDKPKTGALQYALRRTVRLLAMVAGFMPLIINQSEIGTKPNTANSSLDTISNWGRNTNIMAGGSQKHYTTKFIGYTDALLNELNQLTIQSIGEAQNNLERTGYLNNRGERQYPLSSTNLPQYIQVNSSGVSNIKPNHCLNTWSKDGNPKNKFVLLISGYHHSSEQTDVSKYLNKMKESLQNNYLLPENHILLQDNASSKDLTDALQHIADKIQANNLCCG